MPVERHLNVDPSGVVLENSFQGEVLFIKNHLITNLVGHTHKKLQKILFIRLDSVTLESESILKIRLKEAILASDFWEVLLNHLELRLQVEFFQQILW